jgi:hypothetical protein
MRHRHSKRAVAAAALLLFGLAQPTPRPTPGPPCGPTWGVVGSPNVGSGDNSLLAVDAISPTDMWAVGTYQDEAGEDRALTMHWDGAAWTVVPAPSVGEDGDRLVAVSASSSTDVWAVGASLYDGGFVEETLTMHWDGQAWTVVPSPSPGDETRETPLTGVVALSPANAWSVGYFHEGGTPQTLILHWDGVAWKVVPSPNVSTQHNLLLGVTAISATDIWAVGFFIDPEDFADAFTLHWDGIAWTVVPDAEEMTGDEVLLAVDATSSTDVWGVGASGNPIFGQAYGPIAEHWDGRQWEEVDVPDASGSTSSLLAAVAPVANGDIWAVGLKTLQPFVTSTLTEHWDGVEWVVASSPNVGSESNSLAGVTEVSPEELWSVGSYVDETTGASRTLSTNLCPLQVRDDGFSRGSLGTPRGATVAWSISSAGHLSHSVTDATGLELFDSGLRPPGSSFAYTFFAAGMYEVLDRRTMDRMQVAVPVGARPSRGDIETEFKIGWASKVSPIGYVYDVQVRRPGSSMFEDWLMGSRHSSAAFIPDAGVGTYWFRARIRLQEENMGSGYSRPVAIQVR